MEGNRDRQLGDLIFDFYHYIYIRYTVNMNDLFEKLLILRTPGIGPARYNDLVSRFGSVAAAADSLKSDMSHIDTVRREMESASRLGVHYISDDDCRYPGALREMKNHSPIISVRGNIDTLSKPIVSMVGTRHATVAGMEFMANMASVFAENGFVVASGMAMGTDTAAHRGALRASGDAVTIAVLAGGVDYIWPIENESLYYQILERGCVISEMPVGYKPVATNFVQRNRIVAGLCDSLILGEADMKSGSMTTARFAIECGRKLYAVPSHPSDMRSSGPNSLIKDGSAILCTGPNDFFEMGKQSDGNKKNKINNKGENTLRDIIGTIPVSESVLAQVVKKSISEIKSELVVLELQGIVRKVDGGYVLV